MLIRTGDRITVSKHLTPLRRYRRRVLLVRHRGYHNAEVTRLYANGNVEVKVNGSFEAISRLNIIDI